MTGAEVAAIRAQLGMTAAALAALLGVSGPGTIYKWEREERALPGPVRVILTALRDSQAVRDYFAENT